MKFLQLLINRRLVKYSFKKNFGIPLLSKGMLQYFEIHEKHGLPIDLDRINRGEQSHLENDFIFSGLKYLEDIVKTPPLNQIKVCFEIIENNSINAFAVEIKDCPTPVYLIAVNSGLVNEYVKHFIDSSIISKMTSNFSALSQVPVDYLKEAALAMSFCYIAFHELGHVYRGHLKFFREKYSFNLWTELAVGNFEIKNEDYKHTRHLFECDADAFAGNLMVGEVISRYKNGIASGLINGEPQVLLEELIIFCGSIIYYVFCIFDQSRTTFDGWYPVPPIRAAIAMGHMGAHLHKENISEERINELFIEAIARTQAAINQTGLPQSTENLASEFQRWSSKYKDKLSQLSESLIPYAPIVK